MAPIGDSIKEGGMPLNDLCFGVAIGIVPSFDIIAPEDRKKLVRTLCSALLKVDEALDESEVKTK